MADTNVTSEPGKHVIEVEGDNARDRAMNILDALGVEEPAHRMYIEMETVFGEEDSEASENEANTPTPAETDGGGASADTATQPTTPEPDSSPEGPPTGGLGNQPTTKDRPEGISGKHIAEEDREKGDFPPQTSRHYVLAMLNEVGEPLTQKEAERRNKSAMKPGTVSASLSDLYKKKLVDRDKGPERPQGGYTYKYYISDYGKEKLEETETFDPEKSNIFETE